MSTNYLFVAGGSGGHVFPAIAVAETLSNIDSNANISFIGVGAAVEKKLLEKTPWRYETIPSVAVRGKGLAGIARLVFSFFPNLLAARRLINEISPKVLIGFGGYPSVIPLLAARSLGLPCFLQEQNQDVGLANKFLSLFVQKIFAVPGAEGFIRTGAVETCSNPVREIFSDIPKWSSENLEAEPCLVVLGGSQGAVSLNTEILKLVPFFKSRGVKLLHQVGERDFSRIVEEYKKHDFDAEVFPFIDDIASCYRKAHLLICRAGAMTIAEISESGRPAIYIPLPIAGGHQGENARQIVNCGAALLLEHGPNLGKELLGQIERLLQRPEELQRMAEASRAYAQQAGEPAAKRIAKYIHSRSAESLRR
jgi:UDP-N-acetylglucosamine--N-acetylmuramyl-(pentapeptide) pyrophosphoryl-undecaprenol N-acetylglucosamine transferase